ncbi:MAG: SRPBCC domain-containing protein [Opitutaceae bacterium]
MKITVETAVAAPIEEVWRAYTTPEDIKRWNAASDDWHTTASTVDLREGGLFSSRMEARDGSMGFDFAGTYTKIVPFGAVSQAPTPRPRRPAPEPGDFKRRGMAGLRRRRRNNRHAGEPNRPRGHRARRKGVPDLPPPEARNVPGLEIHPEMPLG